MPSWSSARRPRHGSTRASTRTRGAGEATLAASECAGSPAERADESGSRSALAAIPLRIRLDAADDDGGGGGSGLGASSSALDARTKRDSSSSSSPYVNEDGAEGNPQPLPPVIPEEDRELEARRAERVRFEGIKPLPEFTFDDIKKTHRDILRFLTTVYDAPRGRARAELEVSLVRKLATYHPNDPAYDLSKFQVTTSTRRGNNSVGPNPVRLLPPLTPLRPEESRARRNNHHAAAHGKRARGSGGVGGNAAARRSFAVARAGVDDNAEEGGEGGRERDGHGRSRHGRGNKHGGRHGRGDSRAPGGGPETHRVAGWSTRREGASSRAAPPPPPARPSPAHQRQRRGQPAASPRSAGLTNGAASAESLPAGRPPMTATQLAATASVAADPANIKAGGGHFAEEEGDVLMGAAPSARVGYRWCVRCSADVSTRFNNWYAHVFQCDPVYYQNELMAYFAKKKGSGAGPSLMPYGFPAGKRMSVEQEQHALASRSKYMAALHGLGPNEVPVVWNAWQYFQGCTTPAQLVEKADAWQRYRRNTALVQQVVSTTTHAHHHHHHYDENDDDKKGDTDEELERLRRAQAQLEREVAQADEALAAAARQRDEQLRTEKRYTRAVNRLELARSAEEVAEVRQNLETTFGVPLVYKRARVREHRDDEAAAAAWRVDERDGARAVGGGGGARRTAL